MRLSNHTEMLKRRMLLQKRTAPNHHKSRELEIVIQLENKYQTNRTDCAHK